MSRHTIMRRSSRIRWQIPVQITSVDPRVPFDKACETVAVNAHGCGVISDTPLEKGTAVKLGMLPENRDVMARIADVVKLGEDGRAWLLGLQLEVPGNVWGVRNPPHDWEKAISPANSGQDPATAPLAASAAAGATSSGAVATATLAAPEFSLVNPPAPATPPIAVQSAAVAEPAKVETTRPMPAAGNNGGSGQRAEETSRRGGRDAAAVSIYNVRDRDWAELRRQMEEHLQDLMWQVDDQVEAKLEHWKEQMVDAEARLDSLCKLQDRLQAHLTVLSEIVKEKVEPEDKAKSESKQSPPEEAPASAAQTKAESKTELAESNAATASQLEEIRQLQQWMQSLINLLPQAVEQHANEAVGSAEQRLRAQVEEQMQDVRKQVADLQAGLATAATAESASAEAKEAEKEQRQAAQEELRAAGEDIRQSLQKSLRGEFEKLQQEISQQRETAQADSERQRQQQEEVGARSTQQTQEAVRRAEELRQTMEATVGELSRQLRADLEAQLEKQRQQVQEAAAAVEEKSARLQSHIAELTAQAEEASRAHESLESVVASLTQAASQQIKEDVAAGLQRITSETQANIDQRQKDLADEISEVQRSGSLAQEKLTELGRQADELSARLAQGERARESVQSRLDSAIAAAERKAEDSAATILERVGKHSENQIRHLEEQLLAHERRLEELSAERRREAQSALDEHMAGLRASSERMLRGLAEDLRGSLNTHLKEEFASQRQAWEKQREASEAEKAWVESRASELATRWESRLQGYIERASSDAVDKLRKDVEKATGEIIRAQMAEAEKQVSASLEPVISRAKDSGQGLEKLLAALRQQSERGQEQSAAFQRQRDEAQDWMEKQMERLRQAVHDAVVETSGEIKGRIHMAVEMAREPIEQRSREAQRQFEEMAERKTREITGRLAEFEKAMAPRLQAHLDEVITRFQKDTDEVAQKSVHRCQDELEETLNSMLHLVRGKRESRGK